MNKVWQGFKHKGGNLIASWVGRCEAQSSLWFPFLKMPISICVLIMSLMAFNDSANSHPGGAPEIDDITHEIEKDPRNVKLLIKRGELYRFNNDFIKSLSDFDRAAQLDNNNLEIRFQRGLTLRALKRDSEAEMDLTNFIDKERQKSPLIPQDNNKRAIAMVERAQIRARTGRANLALTDYNSAIQLLPVSGLFHARGLFLESVGKLSQAAVGYREGLSQIPNAILLKKSLIRVEVDRKRFNNALVLIDEILESVSVKRSWYLLRADILERMSKPEKAQLAREKALAEVNEVMSKRITAIHRFSRAEIYIALGRVASAKQDLQLAIQMAPNFTESRDLLKKLEGR